LDLDHRLLLKRHSPLVEKGKAVVAGNNERTFLHPEQGDEEKAEIVVYSFKGEFRVATPGTDACALIQTDCSGLKAGDEQKQLLASLREKGVS
jgi:hypothetical protein